MQKQSPWTKCAVKGEVLRSVAQRYPGLDTAAIEIVSMIQTIARSLSANLSARLTEYGLTEGKFYVLGYLFTSEFVSDEPPSPSDIADHVGVTRGTVTSLLDGLERDGFVARRHDVNDRRALTIRLTDKSRALMEGFLKGDSLPIPHSLPLTTEETTQLKELLGRIARRLEDAEG